MRETVAGRKRGEPAIPEAAQTAPVRAYPERTFPVLVQPAHHLVGEPLTRANVGEDAVLQASQPSAVGTDPERTIASLQQRAHIVVTDGRRVRLVEHGEAHSVEPNQPSAGAQPQVAILRLDDGIDRVVGKPILVLPDLVDVLRDGSSPIERLSIPRPEEHRRGCENREQRSGT